MSLLSHIYHDNPDDLLETYPIIISDLDSNPYPIIDHLQYMVLGQSDDVNWAQRHLLLFIFDKNSVSAATDVNGQADANYILNNDDMLEARKACLEKAKLLGHDIDVAYCTDEFVDQLRIQSSPKDVVGDMIEDLVNEVNLLLKEAVNRQAKNLHLEIRYFGSTLKLRVDGEVITLKKWPYSYGLNLAHTLLNQTEKDNDKGMLLGELQSRHLLKTIEGRSFKVDINAMQVNSGGLDVIVHLHDLETVELPLSAIGYSDDHLRMIVSGSSLAAGLVVIAGRSGTGKAESLKAVLQEKLVKSQHRLKLVVIGECHHILIHDSTHISLKGSLPLLVDQIMSADPDLIMIDEINNAESAEMAMHLVQLGFPVYTTTHARSVVGVLDRLSNLGIPPHILGAPGFINCLVYQDYLPALCSHCKVPINTYIEQHSDINEQFIQRIDCVKTEDANIYVRSQGCNHCNNGIKGQLLIAETLLPDFKMLQYIAENKLVMVLAHWLKHSHQIINHGIEKMNHGMVSPEDIESSFGPLVMPVILNDEMIEKYEIKQLSAEFIDKPKGNVSVDSEGWCVNPVDPKWEALLIPMNFAKPDASLQDDSDSQSVLPLSQVSEKDGEIYHELGGNVIENVESNSISDAKTVNQEHKSQSHSYQEQKNEESEKNDLDERDEAFSGQKVLDIRNNNDDPSFSMADPFA